MISAPDPFFKRIMWLTFFGGMLVGIWLTIGGIRLFEFFSILNAALSFSSPPPPLVAPAIEANLGTFQFILLGLILVIEWRVIGWYFQRKAIRQNTDREETRAPLMLLTLGICNVTLGCWILVRSVVPSSAVIDLVLTGGMCIFFGFGFYADLRFLFRVIRAKRQAKLQGRG